VEYAPPRQAGFLPQCVAAQPGTGRLIRIGWAPLFPHGAAIPFY
jgi:hypothetical protein